MEAKENHDIWYFSILGIITFLTIGLINSWDWYNLFSKIETNSVTYEREIAEEKKYISTIGRIYEISGSDFQYSLIMIDSLLAKNKIKDKQWDLNYVKARIYYEKNELDSALKYNAYSNSFYKKNVEKNLFLDVSCYVKKKNFDKAENILNTIENPTIDVKLLKGNFYEVIREKEKAIKEYQEIMQKYPSSYNFLKYNIEEISKGRMSNIISLPKDNEGRAKWIPRPLFYRGN